MGPGSRFRSQVGKGYQIAIGALNEGRIGIGAQLVGMASGAMSCALPFLHERKQFGQAIADFQGMRFQSARETPILDPLSCVGDPFRKNTCIDCRRERQCVTRSLC